MEPSWWGRSLYGSPAECTITGYCRTSIFQYPGAYLVDAVDHQVVYSHGDLKAAIVSDLPAYFERHSDESLHYSIDVSLRARVLSTYEKAFEQAKLQTHPHVPLFIVIGKCTEVAPKVLNSDWCFTVDECLNGEAMLEGGREGESTLLAVKNNDGSWPDFKDDAHAVNIVLAAIKVEQNITHHIEELYSCSCFVSSEGQAVHAFSPTMGAASIQNVSLLESRDIREKAARIESMLQSMMTDSDPAERELFDSMVLEKTKDDGYFRLWYLRLWQALDDAGKHLGYPQISNIGEVIAGKRTPREIKDYRNDIAHWHTGRIDMSHLNDLQHTVIELLRRKYRPTQDGKVDRPE